MVQLNDLSWLGLTALSLLLFILLVHQRRFDHFSGFQEPNERSPTKQNSVIFGTGAAALIFFGFTSPFLFFNKFGCIAIQD